ncbi:hypothetical protein VTJ49DRAFT_4053 [Mycothermus thermophilus]|uniref:Uncharacterized protein n=1 Tax=Humicola insolens TaxID=85995 RepID=A0ABR3V6T1_HUMIN
MAAKRALSKLDITKAKAKDKGKGSNPDSPVKIETFLLSEKPNRPQSTTKILWNYERDPPPDIPHAMLQARRAAQQEQSDTVEELRRWYRSRNTHVFAKAVRRVFMRDVKMNMPEQDRVLRAVDHFFPPRSDIMVTVCDFGPGRAERKEVRLGDIEQDFQTKPEWSTVRWIHAPLGGGLLHSSLEALFFHTGSKEMGPPFTNGGRAGWPYLECEAFDLRSTTWVQDSRDLLRMLKDNQEFNEVLDRSVFAGMNDERLVKDLRWRAAYVGQPLGFWDLAKADLPWQISEGSHLNMNGPSEGLRGTKLEKVTQALSRHNFFKDAHIARNPFRTFHRADGFLLTMSPAAGVDYLNTNLPYYLELGQKDLAEENFASATAQIFREFAETGTDSWFRKTTEWFLVYLITEVGATPHNIRQGYSVPSLMDAYDSIVHELKERRYDRWQRNETIALVRAYLVCLDELNVLKEIFAKKLDFFQRLRKDCERMPELQSAEAGGQANPPDNPQGEAPLDRISFVEHQMKESMEQCDQLGADLRESLNSLFQLRSIEQNELAIMADNQNKAIFVFTAVTIVFLPLSFFTSYFGMNLRGVADTDLTQEYFWKVCGTVSFCIILVVVLWAFRYRIIKRLAPVHRMHAHSV